MPKAKQTPRDALMVSVWAELGAGRITEAYIADSEGFTDGLCDDDSHHITINPAHQVVDTVIHEILHRLHPAWSENYVRNRTTYLRRRMTDPETIQFYNEYLKRRRVRKSVKNGDEDSSKRDAHQGSAAGRDISGNSQQRNKYRN